MVQVHGMGVRPVRVAELVRAADEVAELACVEFQRHLVDDECERCALAGDRDGMCQRGRGLLVRWVLAEDQVATVLQVA